MGLLDEIRNDVKKSGSNKEKIFFVKEGQKARVRFLNDMEEGAAFTFHDNYSEGIEVLCRDEHFGKDCPYCEMEGIRTRKKYCWSVWDYEAKEVKLFLFAVNNCSPLPAITAMYETYGTLTDRDFVIQKTGKQQNTTYSVIPMDKVKFRNTKAKPFSESKILSILEKAYPDDTRDEDEDDVPASKKKTKTKKGAAKEDDDDDDWDDEEGKEIDYSEMSARELYKLCVERGIEAQKKKPEKYYINLLEEYDEANDDWGDEDEEDDDWEEGDE